MSFEVVVHYISPKEENSWDWENPQQKTHRLGKPFESIDYQQLANFCIAQNARRDVLVQKFEVFELAKREITVKAGSDERGSIIIKGRRYRLGDAVSGIIPEDEPEDVQPTPVSSVTSPNTTPAPAPPASMVPMLNGQPIIDLLEMRGKVIPYGEKIVHPLCNGDISRDDRIFPRRMIFTPQDLGADPIKYRLRPGRMYDVLARTGWSGNPDLIDRQAVVIQNDSNEIIKVPETRWMAPPNEIDDPSGSYQYSDPTPDPTRMKIDGESLDEEAQLIQHFGGSVDLR